MMELFGINNENEELSIKIFFLAAGERRKQTWQVLANTMAVLYNK